MHYNHKHQIFNLFNIHLLFVPQTPKNVQLEAKDCDMKEHMSKVYVSLKKKLC